MSGNIIEVAISLIKTEGRFRKDFGDIPALADSIREIGLLQPIGIDSTYRLVFGERRLKAFQQLGKDAIPAHFVNLDSLLKGEYAENEFRKDFTVSERVEIGKALEVELGERRGRPEKGGNISTFSEEGKTRDIAAKAAGFGNGKTYEQAKTVVDEAPPSVIAAVDSGAMSINMASKVVDLPMADIAEIAAVPADQVVEVAKEAIKRAHVANNGGNNEWYTPAQFIELAREVMGGIDTDPATSEVANKTVRATTTYTAETDGRDKPWNGRVWMNPPYAQPLIADFSEAVASKYESGEIEQACVLVNNATETQWFQRMLEASAAVCFPRSRIRFIDPQGSPSGAPLQGQAVLYMGPSPDQFVEAFSEQGAVLLNA